MRNLSAGGQFVLILDAPPHPTGLRAMVTVVAATTCRGPLMALDVYFVKLANLDCWAQEKS